MYQQITQTERYLIGNLRRERLSIRAIAKRLGRSPTTISRELKRNRRESGSYAAERAQEMANVRRRKSRRKSHFDAETRGFIFSKIQEEWAPDQVSMWLKQNQRTPVAAKTIYRWIKKDKKAGGELHGVSQAKCRVSVHNLILL